MSFHKDGRATSLGVVKLPVKVSETDEKVGVEKEKVPQPVPNKK
jgi:hypothetical protein